MYESSKSSNTRRRVPLALLAGAVAAIVLTLGVTGTLSSWTAAIITGNNDSAGSAGSVALLETQSSPVNAAAVACDTASSATNSVSCSTINSYGGIGSTATTNSGDAYGAALSPDGLNSQAVTVNLKNHGSGPGALVLAAGGCANHSYPGASGVDLVDFNLCGQLQLSVSCATPSAFTYAGTVNAFTGGAIAPLASGASTNCTFTVMLPTATPAGYASQYLTQVLTWTLTAT